MSLWLWFHSKSMLAFLITFFESLNSRKMKTTFSSHFWLWIQSKSRLSLLMTFCESRISMKMKRTFSCHFGFGFTAKCACKMLLPFGRFCTELACPCQLSYVRSVFRGAQDLLKVKRICRKNDSYLQLLVSDFNF